MSSSGALFGNVSSRSQNKNLVEFKAGKMNLNGNMVIPDKRKGLVYVFQSEDQLMHLCWKDRQKGTVEDDLIIFPDDIECKPVPQCTTGRVYLLKFKSNNKKMFFWMQESKPDKDSELWGKLNEYLSNPPTPSASRGIPPELAASLGSDGADIQNLLGNMDPQQMMRLITGMSNMPSLLASRSSSSMSSSESNPPTRLTSSTAVRAAQESTAPPTAPTPTAATVAPPSTQPTATTTTTTTAPTTSVVNQQKIEGDAQQNFTPIIHLRDLQDILSNFQDQDGTERVEEIDIMRTITPDVLLPLLVDPAIQERLIPFLPEGETVPKSVDELKQNIESPQFQQTLRSFCNALLSGQLGPLIGQFNLGDEAVEAANRGDVIAFAKALQKHCKKDGK